MTSTSARMTNRVSVCPYALNKLKRQELLDLCTLHTPDMSTVENDMLSNLTVPGLLDYLYNLDEEIYLKKIKRVMPALSKMERQELLDLYTIDKPDMSPVEKDVLNKLTVPGLLNLFELVEELCQMKIPSSSVTSTRARMTNRVSVCPFALNKLKRQELLDLCTLHTPDMSTVENDMLSNLTVPGLLDYLYNLDEEIYLKKIKRVMPALSKMERQELLDLYTIDKPDMSPVEKDVLNKLTVPGLLNLFKLDEELCQMKVASNSSTAPPTSASLVTSANQAAPSSSASPPVPKARLDIMPKTEDPLSFQPSWEEQFGEEVTKMAEESIRKRLRTSQASQSVRPDLSAVPARLTNITDIANPSAEPSKDVKLRIKNDLDY